jgi:hypothetical protein
MVYSMYLHREWTGFYQKNLLNQAHHPNFSKVYRIVA